jgi:hypothetical protein
MPQRILSSNTAREANDSIPTEGMNEAEIELAQQFEQRASIDPTETLASQGHVAEDPQADQLDTHTVDEHTVDEPAREADGTTHPDLEPPADDQPPADDSQVEPAAPERIKVLPEPDPAATINIGGQDVPLAQVEAALGIQSWAAGLTPEQAQAVADVLSGDYQLTPRERAQQAAQQAQHAAGAAGQPPAASGSGAPGYASPATPGQPAPSTPAPPTINPDDFVDPALARYVIQQQEYQAQLIASQTAAYQQQLRQVGEYQAQQHMDKVAVEAQQGRDQFAAKYPFDTRELADIENKAVKMQLVAGFQQEGMSTPAAVVKALESAMWADDTYRAAILAHQSSAPAITQAAQDDLARRRNRASSLASGAAVSRTTPRPDPRTLSPQDRAAAIAKELADYQAANQ